MRDQQPRDYVGVDISEGHLDVHLLPEGMTSRFANDPGGIGRLLAWIGTRSLALVVVEADRRDRAAAGERPAGRRPRGRGGQPAADPGFRSCRRPPGQDRSARRAGARDVRRAHAAAAGHGPVRRQLTGIVQAERDRGRRCAAAELRQSLDQHLAWLEDEVTRIEGLIAQAVAALPDGKPRADLLAAVPGVGPVTVATLLALLPELGRLDGKAVASLTGTAPFARDSGLMRGKRTVWGGRQPVRTPSTWPRWWPPASTR